MVRIFTIALFAGLVGSCVLLGGCFGEPHRTPSQQALDPAGYSIQDGRYSYTYEGGVASKTGVDVSEHQGSIDWEAVAADGIEFAFIRLGYRGATEGSLYLDANFHYNLAAAREAGIECGVYFFSQAISPDEAREEAQLVIDQLGGAQLEYPVVFDHEKHAEGVTSRTLNMTGEQATAAAQAFCTAIQEAGYQAMIYGNGYELAQFDFSQLEEYPVWYAVYGELPVFFRPFVVWQYSAAGQVAGIETAVDLNLDLSEAYR